MITDYKTYEEAKAGFKWSQIWDHFDGDREHFNIAHECIDRHPPGDTAIRIKFDDGHSEKYTFGEMSVLTSKFAHALEKLGIAKDDRVLVMLDPCREYYIALFGTMKRGAVVVPCFTLFGPDALKFRLKDSGASLLVTTEEKASMVKDYPVDRVIIIGKEFDEFIEQEPESYPCRMNRSANDVAVYQYTSGATTKFPEAIKHFHKSLPVASPAAIFGFGLSKGDRYFCPSSPAWGHGLWYGTLTPLSLGIGVGAYSGKFDEKIFLEALEEWEISLLNSAPTVFRRIKTSGIASKFKFKIKKISYTGEPMDMDTFNFIKDTFGVPPHSVYGSTEVGPLIVNYAGFKDWVVVPGSLGKPMLGVNVAIIDSGGNRLPPGKLGEIAIMRKDGWFRVKDAAIEDENGYYWHKGRIDDIILSSGWTISAVEVEDKLQQHKHVLEAVVIGVPDKNRGEIVKAFVRTDAEPTEEFKKELQDFVKLELSKHEYPREIDFVDEIPKTEGGKINRKVVKEWGTAK
ncbi:MAG: AMP-binding protein [Thermodesulfobacteriota bacterium]